ncbi:unnamed protein product [Absidia cylindrospora]
MQSLSRHYLFTSLLFLCLFSTSISAQSSSCKPVNCVAQCQPSCSGTDVCVLSTMSNCGQCPPSKCMSKSALGISSPSDNNSSNKTTDDSNKQQGGDNNSSLIGGLVGGLVGGGLLIGGLALCIHRSRRNITSTLPFQPSAQQHSMENKSVIYPSLSDVPRAMFEYTRNSTSHSIASGVIPITYIPPSHQIQQSIHSLPNSNATTATENPFQDPHHSPYTVDINTTTTTTTNNNNDGDDDDDDMSSRHHSVISADAYPSHHAIQMTRAKPQILRVSSLRRNGSAPTLSTKPSHEEQGPKWMRGNSTIELATTTGSKSNTNQENPFSPDDDDDDLPGSSRPSMNQSLGSTLGDGEITIFWHGQQQQQH